MTYLHPQPTVPTDDLFRKYLDRAISQINELASEITAGCMSRLERLAEDSMRPVLGTGHPMASIFLLKFRPRQAEVEEGVAFFGGAGGAILRSIQRLNIDPFDLYGSNCIKLGIDDAMDRQAQTWLRRELEIVAPRIIVAMGGDVVEALNALAGPEHAPVAPVIGLQQWTAGVQVLVCPDIDDSLESPVNKRSFWEAFRALGDWYAAEPPY